MPAALLLYQNIRLDPNYIISDTPENGAISDYIEGENCVLLVSSPIYLPCYSEMLAETENNYITLYIGHEYERHEEEYSRLYENGEDFYIICDQIYLNDYDEAADENSNAFTAEHIVKYFEKISGYKSTYCTQQKSHYMDICLYKLEKETAET